MVGPKFDSSEEIQRHLSFHDHVPHPHFYQRSTHLYFDTTVPTFGVAIISDISYAIYKSDQDGKWEVVVMASAPLEMEGTR